MNKRAVILSLAVTVSLAVPAFASPIIIDFAPVQLRHGNDSPQTYGTITERADQTGFVASTNLAGQKVYYGTNALNGLLLADIASVTFNFEPGTLNPYVNLAVTNGSDWGVVAGTSVALSGHPGYNTATTTFSNFGFHERYGATVPLGGGHVKADFAGWWIAAGRPLSTLTEEANGFGDPRGPVAHGFAVLWGDSENNYNSGGNNLNVWDVMVTVASPTSQQTQEYAAGAPVPEPATLTLLGLGLAGVARAARRRKK